MKKILVWLAIIGIVLLTGGYLVIEFVVKKKPMGTAKDYWAQLEKKQLTHDANNEPTDVPGFPMGKLFNMFSGWWLLGKVHLGWETIFTHDWSKHRGQDGRLLDYK